MSIEVINISVDQLNALLDEKVEKIISVISQKNRESHPDQWFDLNGLIDYLPSKPKPQTIYEWVHKKIIPYYKCPQTKALQFLRSEIDHWLKQGRRKTQAEKALTAEKYIHKNYK